MLIMNASLIYLFFIRDLPEQKIAVGLVLIEIFAKFAVVIPLNSKLETDVLVGMIEAMPQRKKS